MERAAYGFVGPGEMTQGVINDVRLFAFVGSETAALGAQPKN